MTTADRLNLLLSEILHNESSSSSITTNNPISRDSSTKPSTLLAFAEHDYSLPSITAVSLTPPRTTSSLNNHSRQYVQTRDQSNMENSFKKRPLLNSSTLDDLFHALTLECEQYLADSSTSSYQNKIYEEFESQPTVKSIHIDSNDDDYENLHTLSSLKKSDISKLKTSIEVTSPNNRQIVSVNVSSSQTYPLLSTSIVSSANCCCSSEDDSFINASTSSTTNQKRRRRRTRKQQLISSTNRLSSSDDEQTNTIDKKSSISKRSFSTDYRQQRIQSIYDNHPVSTVSQKVPLRRARRRDVSLQQFSFPPHASKHKDELSLSLHENLASPLSVLLTSKSDFINRSQQRRSRSEYPQQQPVSLLDRMHQKFYRTSPMHHRNNIPTHRIPSYPVY